jgi:hypothetical protein
MSSQSPAPCFFVVGYGRSGTTLLRRMLSAHPRLFVPPENDLFQRIPAKTRRGVRTPAELAELIADFPVWYSRVYDLERFAAQARAGLPMNTPGICELLIRSARIAEGKTDPVWGHKMPSEWVYIPTWRQWFPQAKYVHVVRDPHDAVASMVEHQLQRYPTAPLVGAWQWSRAFRAIRAHGRELGPGAYHLLRYEDLVVDPVATLAALCGFLDVSSEAVPAMIDYRSDPSSSYVDEGGHMVRTDSPLTTRRIGSRQQTQRHASMIDHVCRDAMEEMGYESRSATQAAPGRRAAYDASCVALDGAWAGLRASRRLRGQL